jgi:acetylornithine/N-succinyldiaminopimelate aminotransferase
MPDVLVAEFNHIESARAAINEKTAAVIVEPVQGEGGIHPADNDFLQAVREFCDAHDALLIFDEVQCGIGRTGTLWAHETSGVTPDMLAAAKPLAAGLPIGAVLVTEAVANYLKPGDHASTFAGGPVVTAVAGYVIDRINQPDFLAHVREVGAYLMRGLEALNSPVITEVRGRGLMIAAQLSIEASPIIEAGYDHGLLLVNAGSDVLRFVPPLIVTKADVDAMLATLAEILEQHA